MPNDDHYDIKHPSQYRHRPKIPVTGLDLRESERVEYFWNKEINDLEFSSTQRDMMQSYLIWVLKVLGHPHATIELFVDIKQRQISRRWKQIQSVHLIPNGDKDYRPIALFQPHPGNTHIIKQSFDAESYQLHIEQIEAAAATKAKNDGMHDDQNDRNQPVDKSNSVDLLASDESNEDLSPYPHDDSLNAALPTVGGDGSEKSAKNAAPVDSSSSAALPNDSATLINQINKGQPVSSLPELLPRIVSVPLLDGENPEDDDIVHKFRHCSHPAAQAASHAGLTNPADKPAVDIYDDHGRIIPEDKMSELQRVFYYLEHRLCYNPTFADLKAELKWHKTDGYLYSLILSAGYTLKRPVNSSRPVHDPETNAARVKFSKKLLEIYADKEGMALFHDETGVAPNHPMKHNHISKKGADAYCHCNIEPRDKVKSNLSIFVSQRGLLSWSQTPDNINSENIVEDLDGLIYNLKDHREYIEQMGYKKIYLIWDQHKCHKSYRTLGHIAQLNKNLEEVMENDGDADLKRWDKKEDDIPPLPIESVLISSYTPDLNVVENVNWMIKSRIEKVKHERFKVGKKLVTEEELHGFVNTQLRDLQKELGETGLQTIYDDKKLRAELLINSEGSLPRMAQLLCDYQKGEYNTYECQPHAPNPRRGRPPKHNVVPQ